MEPAYGSPREQDYERLYSLLIEHLTEYAVFITDTAGTILTWNHSVGRIFGFRRDEWIGRNISVIFTPEALADGCAERERAQASHEEFARDARWHLRKDGSRFWVEGVLTAIRNADGTMAVFAKIVRDSTDRHEALEKLHDSERWWRQIVQTAAEGIWVLATDGTIRFANARIAAMLQCTEQDLTGRSMFDFVFEEDRQDALARLRSRLRGDLELADIRLRTVGGEELWVRTAASPVQSTAGEVSGVLSMMSDITEQRRREQTLRRNEERLRLLIASAREYAVVQISPDGFITGWDAGAERLLGWHADEITGRPFELLFTSTDREAGVPAQERKTALLRGSAPNDRWMLRQDGTLFWATGALMPVTDVNGSHTGFVKIMRDMTERKLREDESFRAVQVERDRLQTAIASSQSELRRLSVALISAQETERRNIARELHDAAVQDLALVEMQLTGIARESAIGSEQLQREIGAVRRSIAEISDRLRSLSHGLHSAVLEELGLVVALRSLCDQVRRSTGARTSFAARNVPRTLAPDIAAHLYRIAQEACFNAVRHAQPPAIHIYCYSVDDALVLTVRDSGRGFDVSRGHTGIGLVTMRERARLIDARLDVITLPGRGTTVRVALPVERL